MSLILEYRCTNNELLIQIDDPMIFSITGLIIPKCHNSTTICFVAKRRENYNACLYTDLRAFRCFPRLFRAIST